MHILYLEREPVALTAQTMIYEKKLKNEQQQKGSALTRAEK